jgi:hypothetical protein
MQDLLVDINSSFQLTDGDVAAILPVNLGGTVAVNTTGAIAGGANPAANPANFGGNASTQITAGVGGTSITVGNFVRVSTRFTSIVAPTDPFANIDTSLLGDTAREAIEQTQLLGRADLMREMAAAITADIEDANLGFQNAGVTSIGQAAQTVSGLNAVKLQVLQACVSVATLLSSALSTNRPTIVSYTVPYNMSARMAAFLNGLTVESFADIAVLNPSLVSINDIDQGTVLLIPLTA